MKSLVRNNKWIIFLLLSFILNSCFPEDDENKDSSNSQTNFYSNPISYTITIEYINQIGNNCECETRIDGEANGLIFVLSNNTKTTRTFNGTYKYILSGDKRFSISLCALGVFANSGRYSTKINCTVGSKTYLTESTWTSYGWKNFFYSPE